MGDKEKTTYDVIRYAGRDLPKSYLNMVLSRWLRGFRHGNDYIKLIDSDAYFETYRLYILHTLLRRNTDVRLAVLSDDLDVALGFSIAEGKNLHFVHVQKDFRKQGIARKLVPFEIEAFTHLTRMALPLWPKVCPNAKFNPFL